MTAGQIWAVNSQGGYFYSRQLSNILREDVQPLVKFRQFCDIHDISQQGKKKGDTFTWDVISDVGVGGGSLVETNTMPSDGFTITQGTLTVNEYGNSIPYTGKLENLSKFPVLQPIMTALKNDATKVFDRAAWTQFDATLLRVVATDATSGIALTTNGTATATNSAAYTNGHAKTIVDTMKERNIPAYIGDDYYAITWPTTLRTFKNNLEGIHQYSEAGFRLIMNGEIGRYENVRYVEQTNVAHGRTTDGKTAVPWTNGKSDWIYFFGGDTVMEAINTPEEIRMAIPTDFGRSKGVAWYYIGGFGLAHTTVKNTRVVKWDSAA